MDMFLKANTVRLISYRDRFLVADEDCVTVSQGSNGSAKNTIWAVEFVEGEGCILLRSCYGTYLTATSLPYMKGFSGKKVIQRWPSQSNVASEWLPVRDGMQVRLQSLWGNYLLPSSAMPPWRNSVMHDAPHTVTTWEKALWNVEVMGKCLHQRLPGDYSVQVERGYQNEIYYRGLLRKRMGGYTSLWWLPWHRKICLSFYH